MINLIKDNLVPIVTGAVILAAVIAAWYFSGKIMAPSKEASVREPTMAPPSLDKIRVGGDIWEGFALAHEHNPPVFKENDSWGPYNR